MRGVRTYVDRSGVFVTDVQSLDACIPKPEPKSYLNYCRSCGNPTGTASDPRDARLSICEKCQAKEAFVHNYGGW